MLYTIRYQKVFVGGILDGLTYEETSTASLESCNVVLGWYANQTIVKGYGGQDYKIGWILWENA